MDTDTEERPASQRMTPVEAHAPVAGHGEHDEDDPLAGVPRSQVRRPRSVFMFFIGLLGIALLSAMFFAGFLPLQRREKVLADTAEELKTATPRVAIVNPKRAPAERELILPGQIEGVRSTTIYARTSGYLKKWLVDIGASVKSGDVLAEIDSPEIDMQLEHAQAALLQAQAALQQAKAAVEQSTAQFHNAEATAELAELTKKRFDALRGTGTVTEQDISEKDTAAKVAHAAEAAAKAAIVAEQANVGAADANVAAAQSEVRRLEVLKSFEKVTAPFDGIITSRSVETGSLINVGTGTNGQALFQIDCSDPVRVFIDIPQAYASSIKEGLSVQLLLRELPSTYTGTITRTARSVEQSTRTMRAEVDIPNPKHELLSGMYAQVKINVKQQFPPLILPGSALVVNAEGTQVAIVKDGKVHFQPVVVQQDLGSEFAVSLGLEETDVVIANPSERLTEGMAVTVVNNQQAAK